MKASIILCGLPGTGKTEAGKSLASRLEVEFMDTDNHLELYYERLTGNSLKCRQIYQQVGDDAFRRLENDLLSSWGTVTNKVISIGGGTANTLENRMLLKEIGILVYLKNDRKVIFERVLRKGAPAYLDPDDLYGSFIKMAQKREPVLEAAADRIIHTGSMTPDEIAEKIIEVCEGNNGS